MSGSRSLILFALLLSTVAVTQASRPSIVPPFETSRVPLTMGSWRASADVPIDEDTARQLGADAYINRTYEGQGGAPVGLYMAYYESQRPGVSIHSPLHCLPGTGWEAVDIATLDVPRLDGSIGRARRLVVRKHLDRAVVLYWYEVHGRMIASELTSKLVLLRDSIRMRRSDAALVRVVVPITESAELAEQRGVAFVRDLAPHVDRLF
jgi:EpsI family protein